MNWLLHNPLAALDGPTFLALFALMIGLLALDAWRRRGSDSTRDLDPPPIPSKPDPVEVAYLRGGEREVVRLVAFDLLRRGILRVDNELTPTRVALAPTARAVKLSALERIVVNECDPEADVRTLFRRGGSTAQVSAVCEPLAESLCDSQLLVSPERRQAAFWAVLPGLILIPVVAGAKLLIALARGRHNVGFLFVLLFVGLLIMALISRVPRVTTRGRKYLQQLQTAFEGLKRDTAVIAPLETNPAPLLGAALFGVGLLAGTPYNYVSMLFKKASSAGSCGGGCGGAGGGCGGGGCGGGGCGGGCGGCGGG